MIESSDLANLKEAARDLKSAIKANTEITKENKLSLDMNNLLMLVNLGIISKDDLIGTEVCKDYISKSIPSQKKKSLFK
ncbi:MAG: hypothetical protein HFI87_00400 [Bacilli bacterium]|nr:hypothetical protein [Bacilli bacterium]